ncbi:MAG TPA: YwqI/YxiC family protein [Chondromyces sp.]|nr:YwqI/YxiC family protein [Chondromyces sp.]
MSDQIKIVYEDVEQALTKLKSSTQMIDTSFPSSIGGENVLDTVTKLNEINQALQQLTEAYKALLLKNEEATRQSVQAMKETDEQVANLIAK